MRRSLTCTNALTTHQEGVDDGVVLTQSAQVPPGLTQVTAPHVLQAPGHDAPEGGPQLPRPGPGHILQREHLQLSHQNSLHCGLEVPSQPAVTHIPAMKEST